MAANQDYRSILLSDSTEERGERTYHATHPNGEETRASVRQEDGCWAVRVYRKDYRRGFMTTPRLLHYRVLKTQAGAERSADRAIARAAALD